MGLAKRTFAAMAAAFGAFGETSQPMARGLMLPYFRHYKFIPHNHRNDFRTKPKVKYNKRNNRRKGK